MTDYRRYDIHDLVTVRVHPALPTGLLDQIDFQIGHFRSQTSDSTSKELIITPYEVPDPTESYINHYQEDGVLGEYWHDPDADILVRKTDEGYRVATGNPSININVFLQLLFLSASVSMVHAAGVEKNGRVTLLTGAGGVGKTALVGSLVSSDDYRTLGDDIVCLAAESQCYSFPREFVLKEYHREVYPEVFERHGLDRSFRVSDIRSRIVDFMLANAPFIGITRSILHETGWLRQAESRVGQLSSDPFLATLPITEIFGSEALVEEGTLSNVLFLQRHSASEFGHESVSSDALARRMFAILQTEWKRSAPRLFSLGAFDIIDLPSYYSATMATIRSGIDPATCHLVSIPENATPRNVHQYVREEIEG